MNSLLANLQERFGTEEVNEFGPCVIVPLRDFPKQHEETLKRYGYTVRYQSHRGQSCAFILLGNGDNADSQKTGPQAADPPGEPVAEQKKAQPEKEKETEGKASSARHWTDADREILKQLYSQNVPVEEIAERLKRTKVSVESQAQNLRLRRPGTSVTDAAGKNEPVPEKKPVEHDGHLVKEFLEATSVLYPRFRHAAALILKAAATEMQRGEA